MGWRQQGVTIKTRQGSGGKLAYKASAHSGKQKWTGKNLQEQWWNTFKLWWQQKQDLRSWAYVPWSISFKISRGPYGSLNRSDKWTRSKDSCLGLKRSILHNCYRRRLVLPWTRGYERNRLWVQQKTQRNYLRTSTDESQHTSKIILRTCERCKVLVQRTKPGRRRPWHNSDRLPDRKLIKFKLI